MPKVVVRRGLCFLGVVGWIALAGAPVYGQPFERIIDPFVVADAEGEAYAYPWLGGLNTPRPQFVDIDADGDPDLFVQDVRGRLMQFENVGTPQAPRFVWRSDTYEELDIGEWYRFGDLDADGDADLLAEQPGGYIRYYRNEGTPQQARFVLAADTLRGLVGAARDTFITFSAQNVPDVADLDGSGRPDLFLSTAGGRIIHYRNEGVDAEGLPLFRFVTDTYQGIEIVNTCDILDGVRAAPAGKTLHGASALAFGDVDTDGDLDLLWGDFFTQSLIYVQNVGTATAPAFACAAEMFPAEAPLLTSGYNVPTFTDLDADGDADLLVGVVGGGFPTGLGGVDNLYVLEHQGGSAFEVVMGPYLRSFDIGEESSVAVGDLNGDGQVDLVVGNRLDATLQDRAAVRLLLNEGTVQAPRFRVQTEPLVQLEQGVFNATVALADIDADADLDLFVGSFGSEVALYRNEGTPQEHRFVLANAAFVDVVRASYAAPTFADIDADGDLDLFVGESNQSIHFFRNTGTPQAPTFVLESEAFEGIEAGQRVHPAFVDADGDGDLDLYAGHREPGLTFYRNDGTSEDPSFVRDASGDLDTPPLSTPTFFDLDTDGDADVLLGVEGGGLAYFENLRVPSAAEEEPNLAETPVTVAPNPFADYTTLRFTLPRGGHVRLAVYDLLGREVALLLDAMCRPGAHEVRWNATSLPSGLYVYVLRSGNDQYTGQLVHVGE